LPSFIIHLFCMKRSNILDFIAVLLILMFAYAAFSKLLDFGSYQLQMRLQPLPGWSTPLLVYIIPAIELITVAALLFKKTKLTGFYISAALMIVFTCYVGIAMAGLFGKIPCSCGGVIRHLKWPQHFIFNLLFLLLSFFGIFLDLKERRFIGE
jgi:putative oxidoreductase